MIFAAVQPGLLNARDYPVMMVFGRRTPNVALAAVSAEVGRIAQDLNREASDYHQRFRIEPADGSRILDETDAVQSLQVLTIVWGVLLATHLIACSNVGSVLVARAVARRPEIATRLALGASRAMIVRQLLAESLLLTTLAVAFGVAIAIVTLRILWLRRRCLPRTTFALTWLCSSPPRELVSSPRSFSASFPRLSRLERI